MKNVIDLILTSSDLYDSIKHSDEQTQKLALEVLRKLRERFAAEQFILNALQRLLGVVREGKDWSPDLIRNNVFKVAHELEMDLPSSSF